MEEENPSKVERDNDGRKISTKEQHKLSIDVQDLLKNQVLQARFLKELGLAIHEDLPAKSIAFFNLSLRRLYIWVTVTPGLVKRSRVANSNL